MRNFIAEGDFLGTFADRAVSGAARGVVFLSARLFYTWYAKKTHRQHTCQIKLSLFPSASPFTCNFFSICHLQC